MSITSTIPEAHPAAIRKTPGVAGGEACVADSRIPVWGLVSFRRQGSSDEELLTFYPTLSADDLTAAWDYARRNPAEIERAISRNERD